MTDFCRVSLDTRLQPQTITKRLLYRKYGSPVIFHYIGLAQFPKEILIVSDDDELEIVVILSFIDDTTDESLGVDQRA